MRQLARFLTTAAAIVVTTPAAMLSVGTGAAGADTLMSFAQMYRRCDFSTNTFTGPSGYARPFAVVRRTGSTDVVADVTIATAVPFTHYDVRLIQMPRPSSKPCGRGDPGVDVSALVTDAAGAASTTVRGNVAPGATGVWLFISRPDAFRQTPAEFYTTDFIADV
jgi:hypothetical protein